MQQETSINALKLQLIDEQRSHTVQSGTGQDAKLVSVSPSPAYNNFYRNRSVSPSSVSAIIADDNNDDFWSYDVSGGGYSSFLERLRSKLQQREGELAVIRVNS